MELQEENLETKIEAMKFYDSETKPYPFPRSNEGIKTQAMMRGMQGGFEYAEAFQLIRKLEKMRIACVGYREWALKIYTNIQKKSDHIFLNIKNYETYSDRIIKDFGPDLVMFYGWSWIVSKDLIENFTCLMLHPSPLPLYRGRSPLQNQIIEGKKTSKVSIIIMTEELDAGPIVGQMDISLEGNISDIFQELTERVLFLLKKSLKMD